MIGIRHLLIVLALSGLAGCATPPAQRCAAGEQLLVSDLIYFGTGTTDGAVTVAQWEAFLAEVVTPRFPQGLTTWQASGQWRGNDGRAVHEDSHVLNLVHPHDAATEAAVGTVIEDYKRRFRQEAVLRVRSPACASF